MIDRLGGRTQIAFLVALAAVLAGCGASGSAGQARQAVEITARVAPVIPLPVRTQDAGQPFRGRFVLTQGDGVRIPVSTDAHGKATLRVTPGTYQIALASRSAFPRLAEVRVSGRLAERSSTGFSFQIRPAARTRIVLTLDSGIR